MVQLLLCCPTHNHPMHNHPMQVLIASVDLGCSDEILTILPMLSAQNIFHR